MEQLINFIIWLVNTGLNEGLAKFVANNSLWCIPAYLVVMRWLKYRASLTPETWDDEAITDVEENLGHRSEE